MRPSWIVCAAALPIVITLAAAAENTAPLVTYTATTDNVSGAPDDIRIDLFRWSTDAERDQLVAAWNMTGSPGGGGGRGGRGQGPASIDATDPAFDSDAAAPAAGRGRGRGRGRGLEGATTPKTTPEMSLAAVLKQSATVGYVWSSEIAGYALKYAAKLPGPNGADRIILITDRRLGATNKLWTPLGTALGSGVPQSYDFSVMELRLNSKGEGEGKISLAGKVAPDSLAKVVAPEDYSALPIMLKNVKPRVAAAAREDQAAKRKP